MFRVRKFPVLQNVCVCMFHDETSVYDLNLVVLLVYFIETTSNCNSHHGCRRTCFHSYCRFSINNDCTSIMVEVLESQESLLPTMLDVPCSFSRHSSDLSRHMHDTTTVCIVTVQDDRSCKLLFTQSVDSKQLISTSLTYFIILM